MSSRSKNIETLKDIQAFGHQFLQLSPQQRVSFLAQIRRKQCGYIRESATNILLNNNLSISSTDRDYFRKKKYVLKVIASKGVCLDYNRYLLPKYGSLIKRIMVIIVNYIGKLMIRYANESNE